ncbi:protein of unknown function (plasmid) [Rhodovastum atsumiense]|nr:protein of unknown function [Rhodovastum atsumiense]
MRSGPLSPRGIIYDEKLNRPARPRANSWRSLSRADQFRRDGRFRRVQHQAAILDFDLGVWIDGQGQGEVGKKPAAEDVHAPHRGAKLDLQGGPGHGARGRQDMKAIGQPAVDVDRLRVVRHRFDGGVLKRHGMLLELAEEAVRQRHAFGEQAFLRSGADEHGRLDDVMAHDARAFFGTHVKREGAEGDPLGLVAHGGDVLAGARNAHLPEPLPQAAAEFHVPAAGAQSFGLEIDQDQARAAAVGNADGNGRIALAHSHPRLDDEADMLAFDLPALAVGQPLVRQGGLAPAGIEEANAAVLIRQVGGGRLDDVPAQAARERGLLPVRHQDVMHLAHAATLPRTGLGRKCELLAEQLLGRLFGFYVLVCPPRVLGITPLRD